MARGSILAGKKRNRTPRPADQRRIRRLQVDNDTEAAAWTWAGAAPKKTGGKGKRARVEQSGSVTLRFRVGAVRARGTVGCAAHAFYPPFFGAPGCCCVAAKKRACAAAALPRPRLLLGPASGRLKPLAAPSKAEKVSGPALGRRGRAPSPAARLRPLALVAGSLVVQCPGVW